MPATNQKKTLVALALSLLASSSNAQSPIWGTRPLTATDPAAPATAGQALLCYQDDMSNRIFSTRLDDDNNLTIQICRDNCAAAGFDFAGVQYYRECWCGSDFTAIQNADLANNQNDCNTPCDGNQAEVCGGNTVANIAYSVDVGSPPPPPPPPPPADPNEDLFAQSNPLATGTGAKICFDDDGPSRILIEVTKITSNSMTIQLCKTHCFDLQHTFAGLQYGVECWCGSEQSKIEAATQGGHTCDMPCAGDATQLCGTAWAMNIAHSGYTAGPPPPPPPATGEKMVIYEAHSAGLPGYGYYHSDSAPKCRDRALEHCAAKGWECDVETSRDFLGSDLSQYKGMVFCLNTGHDAIGEYRADFQAWFESGGKGWMGAHSGASDIENGYYAWQWFRDNVSGALFDNHPDGTTYTFTNDQPNHPLMAGVPASFDQYDERYNFQNGNTIAPGFTVVLSQAGQPTCFFKETSFNGAVSRGYGSNIGHNGDDWNQGTTVTKMLENGLDWIMDA